ncbi:ECF RNA polymerase sigma factor SigE [bacterium HR10]|nr:ECF RNA polymerase sigma factor SigE [bacterium HR10]
MTAYTDTLTDVALAQASAAGDMSAFEELYRRHRRKVYSLCLRMLGNVPDAEDLTQEVFLQLYRKIGSFKGAAALSTWLYRLTVNRVLMYLRTHRRQQEEQLHEGEEIAQTEAMKRPRRDGSIIDRIDLERAIRRLPPGYRAVFLLHDMEGYEHEEIARLLGIAVGTAKSQLHKARMKLRELLGADASGHSLRGQPGGSLFANEEEVIQSGV